MLLGFFDSGRGGQSVLDSFRSFYPDIEMILETDPLRCPYGGRPSDEIREFTREGVEKLFDRGADVVILACNTATVHALRWLQTEIFPDRHILGVTIPGAERVVELGLQKIGVLATEATVRIRAYRDRVHILDDRVEITEIGAPELVPLIEAGITEGVEIEKALEGYIAELPPDIEAIVLGCTHYPIVSASIEKSWLSTHRTPCPLLIDPGYESAMRFGSWMERHGM